MKAKHTINITFTALLISLLTAALPAASKPFYQPPSDVFQKWEDKGYGSFSGSVQAFYMRRDVNNTQGASTTTALTLNHKSPSYEGLSTGVQYIYSLRVTEGDGAGSEGYWLSNDDHNDLNELYLDYQLAPHWNLENTSLRIGRQILNYDFAPKYAVRQKAQAYEGVVLKIHEWENFKLDLGHIERFSSWSSRDEGNSTWRANFIDVEDRIGVNYKTRGMQFFSSEYSGLPQTKITVYDFYGQDTFNTFGGKLAYDFNLGEDCGTVTLRTHYAQQRDVGKMQTQGTGSINSKIWELAADYKYKKLSTSVGFTRVGGIQGVNDFQTPFRTGFTIDPTLLWYTRQFLGDTDSYFAKAVYKHDAWMFYSMYVGSKHTNSLEQEINGVVKYQINKNFYAIVKAGYAERDNDNAADTNADDIRWFFGYTF